MTVAVDMLDGRMHLIEGARRISELRVDCGDPDSDVFLPIRAVDSDTDHYPLGSVRNGVDSEYLRRLDGEMRDYLAEMSPVILDACRRIVARFSSPPV